MDIKLRFVNKSNDGNKSEVLIYQKNVLTTMASLSVAWKVIRYCGRDCTHRDRSDTQAHSQRRLRTSRTRSSTV